MDNENVTPVTPEEPVVSEPVVSEPVASAPVAPEEEISIPEADDSDIENTPPMYSEDAPDDNESQVEGDGV